MDRFKSVDGLCASKIFPIGKILRTGGLIGDEKLIPLETLLRATRLNWGRYEGNFDFINGVICEVECCRLDHIDKVLIGRLNEEGR